MNQATDSVTRLPNRDALRERLDEEIARAERYGVALSLLLADIDGFSGIVGRQGEAAGNAVLQRLALALLSTVRESDMVARIGADKFALLLPDTDAPGALARARRLGSEIAATDVGEEATPLRVTLCIGVTTFRPGLAESGALMAHAEEALGSAKQRRERPGGETAVCAFPDEDGTGGGETNARAERGETA